MLGKNLLHYAVALTIIFHVQTQKASAGNEFGEGQACEIVVRGHAFFGESASTSIRAHENKPCILMWSWDTNSVLTWFRVARRPRHGLAGVYMQTNLGYKPNSGFVGSDDFAIEYKGYGKIHSGISHFEISVDVVP